MKAKGKGKVGKKGDASKGMGKLGSREKVKIPTVGGKGGGIIRFDSFFDDKADGKKCKSKQATGKRLSTGSSPKSRGSGRSSSSPDVDDIDGFARGRLERSASQRSGGAGGAVDINSMSAKEREKLMQR